MCRSGRGGGRLTRSTDIQFDEADNLAQLVGVGMIHNARGGRVVVMEGERMTTRVLRLKMRKLWQRVWWRSVA